MTDTEDPKPWRLHTARFVPRAIAMGMTTFEFVHDHIDALQRSPLAVKLSDAAAIEYQVALLAIGVLRSAREIAISSGKLWLQGHFLVASVGIRMLIELTGQLIWAEKKVLAPLTAGQIEVPFERIKKLLLGSQSAIPLIRGEFGPHPLVNVMEFVRATEEARPGTMADYEFLCDSAHPSYMMQSWMLFAGPPHDNWTNETFAIEVGPILDRMLVIAEAALTSLEVVADRVLNTVVPAILAETGPA